MNVPQPPVNILRTGRAEESPASSRQLLRAGPLSLVFDGGDLRYLKYGGREVIRRIYVAVRDQNWNTVAPQFSDLQLDAGEDHFHATFQAIHRAGELDFRWRGEIRGSADGTITYLMDGAAHSTFWRNRIGCCVLHPMRECADLPCVAEKVDGSLLDGRFPAFIAPHQPFIDLRALSYEVAPGVGVEVRCEGDTFEMEDQRNWGDASFKTYGTPLSLPRPAEVPSGARIVQQITIKLRGPWKRQADEEEGAAEVTFDDASASVLPRLGIALAQDALPLGEAAARRLRALNLSHLRIDCGAFAPNLREAFARFGGEARKLALPLELALFLSDEAEKELADVAALWRETNVPVARFLIFHRDETSTAARWVELARRTLSSIRPAAIIGAGTNNYFTEINRERPASEALDVLCYSLNPQVHASDDLSVMENLAAQTATVQSARQFARDAAVAVTPITLRPRFNPHDKTAARTATDAALPPSVDPRQMSLFAAAWTVGSLRHIAEGGAASATYYETHGWRGVMEAEGGSPRQELFPSPPGGVFPLYHVLADVGEFAATDLIPADVGDHDLRISGFALRRADGSRRILLANLTPETQPVVVGGLPESVRLKLLDETNAPEAMLRPEEYRAAEGEVRPTIGGRLTIGLRPYGVARLDY